MSVRSVELKCVLNNGVLECKMELDRSTVFLTLDQDSRLSMELHRQEASGFLVKDQSEEWKESLDREAIFEEMSVIMEEMKNSGESDVSHSGYINASEDELEKIMENTRNPMTAEMEVECRKPLPVFLELPAHIKEKISDQVHPITKQIVRQCSKGFKDLMDHAKTRYHQLEIGTKMRCLVVSLWLNQDPRNKLEMEFHYRRGNNCLMKDTVKNVEKWKKQRAIPEAITFFMKQLKKYSFNILKVSDDHLKARKLDQFYELLKSNVEQLSKPFHVGELNGYERGIAILLNYAEPGTLQKISVRDHYDDQPISHLKQLVELPQWKKASDLHVNVVSDLQLSDFFHAKRMHFKVEKVLFLTVVELIERTEPHREFWSLGGEEAEYVEIANYLQQYPSVERGISKYYTLPSGTIETMFSYRLCVVTYVSL